MAQEKKNGREVEAEAEAEIGGVVVEETERERDTEK